jgi:signal transduction histidine kinase
MNAAGVVRARGGFGEIVRWGGLVGLFALCLAVRPVVSFYVEGKMPMTLPELLAVAWLVNLLVALPVLPVVMLAERRTSGMAPWPRNAVLAGAVILATLLGVGLRVGFGWLAPWAGSFPKGDIEAIAGYWMERSLLCFGLAAIYVFHARTRTLADAAHAEEIAQQRLARQGTEASLQALQAQIEPHFLFNTLANVRRLLQSDPDAGREMLRHLQQYLRTSWANLSARLVSVSKALDLVEAYLRIQAVRMGTRLNWRIEADADAVVGMLPPLMLMTLVENAIKHGLGPLPDGGTVHIAAQVVDGRLELRVSDDGAGFRQSSGGGTGLANVRTRLGLLYGNAAQLRLARNTPRGVVAVLSLPYRAQGPA